MKKASRQLGSGCPPWKPDCPGAPGSYRVELIGVTPLTYHIMAAYCVQSVTKLTTWAKYYIFTLILCLTYLLNMFI
jgi:hypothetical protein